VYSYLKNISRGKSKFSQPGPSASLEGHGAVRVAFWISGRTNVAVISQFGQVVRHSGLCKFHSCAFCGEVSYQGHNEEPIQ